MSTPPPSEGQFSPISENGQDLGSENIMEAAWMLSEHIAGEEILELHPTVADFEELTDPRIAPARQVTEPQRLETAAPYVRPAASPAHQAQDTPTPSPPLEVAYSHGGTSTHSIRYQLGRWH